jgi:CxxC motif-containing protein
MTVNDSGSVSGNFCGRGAEFVKAEITRPMRTLTTTIKTVFPSTPMLSVRTVREIPKANIPDVMRFLNSLTINEKLGVGDIVVENVLGLNSNVIATSALLTS